MEKDFGKIENKVKELKGFKTRREAKEWLRNNELTGHHKSATEIELVPTKLHQNVPHIGSASDMRNGFQ
ncbi:HNH endonuclease [Megamonas funiformis]|uniref:HNH endonuclease n=1 Tax=Megamonas funiformis TaxID=437897 RepID=UPI00345E7C26